MSAITFVLLAFISVSSGLLEGIPPQEVLHSDATLQLLMSEVTRLSNELKEAQEKISTLDNQVDKLTNKDRDIAFFAYLGPGLVNPSPGTTIVFNEPMTNSGNNYDPQHGVFTASVNGTYNFHLIAASPENSDPSHQLHLYITKNKPGSYVSYGWLDRTTDHWVQTSASAVLHLCKGDRIWVEVGAVVGSHTLAGHSDNRPHTYWSGFLIHAD
ncbi:C1QL [Mytilus edulis]|uniref:C1QL n=1 Tax=Mytilus edulis TaxID=6550 RepID=A0A8S3Q8I1_MYTED|nr:C1QL [Mytilus edulis]